MAKAKYIDIMSRLIIDEDEGARDKEEIHFDYGLDKDCRQAYFLAHHQLLAFRCWLLFCPQEAAFFQQCEVSKLVRLCLDYDESI